MKNINYSLLFKANMFLTICLFIPFMIYNNSYEIVDFLMIFFGSISSAIIIYILIYILTFIFAYKNNIILYIMGLLFIFVDIALVVDFFIFRLYKFHINAMVLNIITSPDAVDSIQLGIAPVILFVSIVLFFIIFEISIIKKLLKSFEDNKKLLNKQLNKLIIVPFIIIVLGEKVAYGYAALFNHNDIMVKFKVIPLYQPLTFNRIAYKYFGIKPDVEVKNTIKINGELQYPLHKLNISSDPNKINIFIIASDAVRNSILNKQTAPNIEQFKKDSIVLQNHRSGGNATRFGIFSLMYGINATYWFSFLDNAKGSVLFDVLKQLDYQIDIISSTNTSWPEFRKTAYVNIIPNIKDDFPGVPWEKDKQSSQYLLNKIPKYNHNKPIFAFLFMDSPHGYSFPPSINKFHANDKNINYLTVTKDGKDLKSIFASYKNAVYYNDKLFGKIIKKLKENNLYDNSLIIYTSDHGQEFYEYGFFGHNSAFSKAQTNSPMIIKLPNSLKNKLTITNTSQFTSHLDIVPTLLSLIGVTNPPNDYSSGYNLFDKNYHRDYAFIANWNDNAIITSKYTYVFSNMPDKLFKNEIRDTKTYKLLTNNVKVNSKLVLDIINQNKRFLK